MYHPSCWMKIVDEDEDRDMDEQEGWMELRYEQFQRKSVCVSALTHSRRSRIGRERGRGAVFCGVGAHHHILFLRLGLVIALRRSSLLHPPDHHSVVL